ncbi:MAG: FAD-dependent oxidoreductase [Erysipelotrichaceae bacterium]|nr:FAD-dependent oxidoreductase [Erysipelotrichaceae bacterium]MDD4641894.1 FAD-dependent oxidoreductase [Erysipelotrichaceae bacterium]
MIKNNYQLVVIGGGPAGLAGAITAYENGLSNILIIERNEQLGGILQQCIHNGFGLHLFKEELTGPEYAARWIQQLNDKKITIMLNTTVIDINENKEMTIVNETGLTHICAERILLAMGCRERTRGAILTPGYRPAGIFTAGLAQKLVNIYGYLPGQEIVIVGSGDIGLIMARRLTLERAKVKLITEIMPYSSGLIRNIVQCQEDFMIPLRYNTTITKICGQDRVTGVMIANVDKDRKPIKETEEFISCDTVLFSVGLIPENELSQKIGISIDPITKGPIVDQNLETSVPGIYACGNVLHVHDLVDNVSSEAKRAAMSMINKTNKPILINVSFDKNIRYVVPQKLTNLNINELILSFRVKNVYRQAMISVKSNDMVIYSQKKHIMTPGEMIQIKLISKQLEMIKDDLFLSIEVNKNE